MTGGDRPAARACRARVAWGRGGRRARCVAAAGCGSRSPHGNEAGVEELGPVAASLRPTPSRHNGEAGVEEPAPGLPT